MMEIGAWALLLGYVLSEAVESDAWQLTYGAVGVLGFVLVLTGVTVEFWKAAQ